MDAAEEENDTVNHRMDRDEGALRKVRMLSKRNQSLRFQASVMMELPVM